MVWTIEFTDGRIKTYDHIEEVHKNGKIYAYPFKDLPILFSSKIVFVHSDGRQTYIDGDTVKKISIP